MTAVVYTDASYNQYKKIAACGYCILVDGELTKHEVQLYENVINPTQAEVIAVVQAIQCAFMLKGVEIITVKCDCKSISVAVNADKVKGKKLKRYDEYKELKETIAMCAESGIAVIISHIKAHSTHKYNNMVDLSCKTNLRNHVKNINEKAK